MARKTDAQLDAEIQKALASVSPGGKVPTLDEWKAREAELRAKFYATQDQNERAIIKLEHDTAMDAIKALSWGDKHGAKRAAQRAASRVRTASRAKRDPHFVTDTNLFALKQEVVENGGPIIGARVSSTRAPHIKRTLAAGLLEPVDRARLRLTAEGRQRVADQIVSDIDRMTKYPPRPDAHPSEQKRHDLKLARLESTLAALR